MRSSYRPASQRLEVFLQLPAQLSYDDAISVEYRQQFSTSVVSVTQFATAGYYRGTPGTWVLPTPDLSGAPGWEEAWELVRNPGKRREFAVTIEGYGDGRLGIITR